MTVAAGAWLWQRASRRRWVRETATPEIARLLAEEDFAKAAALARQAGAVLPGDAALEKLRTQATMEVSVESVPSGAEVFTRPYRGDAVAWESLGTTPLQRVRVPKAFYLWRIVKPGYETAWRIAPTWNYAALRSLTFRLQPHGSAPAAMVSVPGGRIALSIPGLDHLAAVQLDDYWIDRHEVTNEEYRKFVDAGGYEKPAYWKPPFLANSRTLAWPEAIARSATPRVDRARRPGIWAASRRARRSTLSPV